MAWNRDALSLRASLARQARRRSRLCANAAARSTRSTNAARHKTPFAFFAHVLGPLQGRAKILARLGPEANDALDEFLNLALDYETRQTPSLQGFVAWLRAAQSEVRRDMEMARDEVRVMTVHGAKGLEANTVFLADTTTPPGGPRDPRLLALGKDEIVWATARGNDAEAMATARAQTPDRGARRISPPALCRDDARRRTAGRLRRQGREKNSGRLLVSIGQRRTARRLRHRTGFRRRRRSASLSQRRRAAAPQQRRRRSTPRPKPVALPDWLRHDAPREAPAMRTVTPSGVEDDTARPAASGGAGLAMLRGSLVHRLMQSLPDIPAERRLKAAQDYLARAGDKLPADDQAQNRRAGHAGDRGCALRRAIRPRQPRRSADRRQGPEGRANRFWCRAGSTAWRSRPIRF